MNKINAYYIKTVLMEYYRFNRQCLCADEVMNSDIIVLTKKDFIHEIEVKCAKSDLCSLELKKEKHQHMSNKYAPHYFSFAVPTSLVEDAFQVIETLNPKYGLIEITNNYNPITIRKSPKQLHIDISFVDLWKHRIIYRLNSALIGYMKKTWKKEENEQS